MFFERNQSNTQLKLYDKYVLNKKWKTTGETNILCIINKLTSKTVKPVLFYVKIAQIKITIMKNYYKITHMVCIWNTHVCRNIKFWFVGKR